MHIRECRRHKCIDTPEQMVLRDVVVETKLIARLITAPSTHHNPPPTSSRAGYAESSFAANLKPFSDSIGQTRTSADVCGTTSSPLEADMTGSPSDVVEVPIATIAPYRIDAGLR